MNRIRVNLIALLMLSATVLTLTPASAGVISQSVTFDQPLGSSTILSFDKFDASLGALTQIEMAYDVMGVAQFEVGDPGFPVSFFETFDVASSISFDSLLTGTLAGRGSALFLGPLLGLPNASGIGFGYVMGQGTATISDSSTLGSFTGATNDSRDVTLSTTPFSSTFPVLNAVSRLSGELSLTYFFDEGPAQQQPNPSNATLPEPSSLAVFGLGAVVMVGVRRRRNAQR
jgi:hypothetical protein